MPNGAESCEAYIQEVFVFLLFDKIRHDRYELRGGAFKVSLHYKNLIKKESLARPLPKKEILEGTYFIWFRILQEAVKIGIGFSTRIVSISNRTNKNHN